MRRSAWLTRSLMTVQFGLAFITIIVSGYLGRNNDHLLTVDWGYEPDKSLYMYLPDGEPYGPFANEVARLSQVEQVTGSVNHVGMGRSGVRVHLEGGEVTVPNYAVGTHYFEALNIPLAEGREFRAGNEADLTGSVVINKRFAEERGWETSVGQTMRVEGVQRTVIGVVDNVLLMPFASKIPVVYTPVAEDQYRLVVVRTAGTSEVGIMDSILPIWERQFPNTEFDAQYQREVFDISYNSLRKLNKLFMAIALLSLFIACMGLFGLASQNATTRMKEMAVRKSLGASTGHLAYTLNKGFLTLILIAGLVASPLCYFGVNGLLGMLPTENLPLGALPFAVAYTLVLLTAGLAVFLQSRKITHVNPAEVLKTD